MTLATTGATRTTGATGTARTSCPGAARTVGEVMVTGPKTWGPSVTVAQARDAFGDDHVHALLLIDGRRLVAVVERADLAGAPGGAPARERGRTVGRTVGPATGLDRATAVMARGQRRRLAVVDRAGDLLGLLCLQGNGRGFCSDEGVQARAAERAALVDGASAVEQVRWCTDPAA